MGESKHTRGPWSLGKRTRKRQYIDGPGWTRFAKVVVRMNFSDADCEDGLANALLIAAAPDLLEALRFIANQEPMTFAECTVAEAIMARAKQAIAKAEGTPTPNSTTLLSAVSAKGE